MRLLPSTGKAATILVPSVWLLHDCDAHLYSDKQYTFHYNLPYMRHEYPRSMYQWELSWPQGNS